MKEYHKIQTVFKRDPETNFKTLLEGEYSLPCFEYLKENKWVFTEKVDGTNIRIILDDKLTFKGKTDKAQLPPQLVARLYERFSEEKLRKLFPEGVCLYGEGYGPKIQKGGGNYRKDQDFVLFDVKVGSWWLDRDSLDTIAIKLGLDLVPIIGVGPLRDMINWCRTGFKSDWGSFQAEGLVGKPAVEIQQRNGQRIITKLKCKDFREDLKCT